MKLKEQGGTLIETRVWIPELSDETTFHCHIDPSDTWNGYAKPYFLGSELEDVASLLGGKVIWGPWKEGQYYIQFTDSEESITAHEVLVETSEGIEDWQLYSISGYCFEEYENS